MKTILKITILILAVLFLVNTFSDYFIYKKYKKNDPFIHLSCRLAHEGRMGGSPCAKCRTNYDKEFQNQITDVIKKWKKARGDFNLSTEEEVDEFLQIAKKRTDAI